MNFQSFPASCPFCNLFTAFSQESMEEHQRDTGCMRAYVTRQLSQSGPSSVSVDPLQEQASNVEADQLSDMSVSARSDLTHISDMDISVGGGTPSIHS